MNMSKNPNMNLNTTNIGSVASLYKAGLQEWSTIERRDVIYVTVGYYEQ